MEVHTYVPLSQSNLTVTYNKELDRSKLEVKFCSAIQWIIIISNFKYTSLCFLFFFISFLLYIILKQSERILRESLYDFKDSQKKLKSLGRLHGNLVFCLQELGSFGALQAAKAFLLSFDGDVLDRKESDMNDNSTRFKHHYLNKAISVLSSNILDG
uniref:Uncharacterized protein n=1 Tax=Aegilops tauschii subsp. strangulata TaxID=200361 RepID=A0A453CF27_AEGTS